MPDPEDVTQAEVRDQADEEPDDPATSREELEVELMDRDASELGEEVGDPSP